MKTRSVVQKLKEARQPEVGIFFFIKGKIYGWGDPVREMTPVAGIYDSPEMHQEYFDDLISVFPELGLTREDEYSWYPRGRVMYSEEKDKFIVIADKCLLSSKDAKFDIASEFNLPMSKIEWETDDHYSCKDCDEFLSSEYKKVHG